MTAEKKNKPDTAQVVHMLDTQRAEITRLNELLTVKAVRQELLETRYHALIEYTAKLVSLLSALKEGDTITDEQAVHYQQMLYSAPAHLREGTTL